MLKKIKGIIKIRGINKSVGNQLQIIQLILSVNKTERT